MNDHREPYRSRRGIILGVCRGLADYFCVSVFWVRLAVILGTIFTGFWPMVLVYLLVGVIMKPEPVRPVLNAEEHEFYDSCANSRTLALQRLKATFDRLDRRVRRMEDAVVSRAFDWDRRFGRSA